MAREWIALLPVYLQSGYNEDVHLQNGTGWTGEPLRLRQTGCPALPYRFGLTGLRVNGTA
jgi:hypothetical protein